MKRLLTLVAAFALSGCTTLQIEGNVEQAVALSGETAASALKLRAADEERLAARAEVERLLESPLSANDAVRIGVVHGAALQAALFESAAGSAAATQSTRIANPIFTFDRLVRKENGVVDLDIGRMLSVSLFDVLLLPQRLRAADYRQQHLTLRAAGDIVQAAAEARSAWVRAVAAEQAANYALQVKASADAGAELARRMQAVGNFSKLQRAREQAFYAEAVTQVARAEQAARAAREALVRVLGLDEGQAARLRLPERLPDLPPAPQDEATLARTGLDQRLDVRMARAELDYLARTMGLVRVTSVVDGLHLAAVRNSETGKPPQRGFELEMPLPIFDFGDAKRAEAQATYMAALNRAAVTGMHASSQLRESYAAYRTTYDISRHYRNEVLPLRKVIADEALLRYNGMLIGVFELLAETRAQVAAVTQSLEAERDFWLADAALRAAIVGRPLASIAMDVQAPTASSGVPQRH